MCRLLLFVLAGMMVTWAAASVARADFQVISDSVLVDPAAQVTHFSLTFNQLPNFVAVDEFDRPANAFQYWYDAQPGGFEFSGEDVVVIRGPELRFGGELPIRASLNESGEEFPGAEGWGAKVGEVPFELEGTTFTFSVPWDVLGENDGRFSYRLAAFEFGSQTNEIVGIFIALPRPVELGVGGFVIMLIGLGIARRWTR
jgi:hypothetical protein